MIGGRICLVVKHALEHGSNEKKRHAGNEQLFFRTKRVQQEAVYVVLGLAMYRPSVRKSASFDACFVGHCSFEEGGGRS